MDIIYAAKDGDIRRVQELLDSGADINIGYIYGTTALMYATYEGYTEIVRLLLENGADPNIQNRVGSTALMYATYEEETELVRLLLENGANPNLKNKDGDTALDVALTRGYTDIIDLLKYYIMMYKMQRKRRRNLTYRKKRTQLAHKNLALSKLLDTYDVDEPLIREMRRTNVSSIFG